MTIYGVRPEGFVRKPLAVTLAEVEAQLITEFGPELVQTAQSPMGQLNGLFAAMITNLWEVAEDVYQSYDPDQSEGVTLDTLGRLRLVSRGSDENDAAYRQAITNEGAARVTLADLTRAVRNIAGVSFVQTFVNEEPEIDRNMMPPNTVAVAVLGGNDDEVAVAVNRFIPPGISTHGNVAISAIEEGYCRTIRIIRPVETEVALTVQVKTSQTRRGCPAPSPTAVGTGLLAYLTARDTRPWNGQDIDAYLIRAFIESAFPGVEYISHWGTKAETEGTLYSVIPIDFFEIADVTEINVLVSNA